MLSNNQRSANLEISNSRQIQTKTKTETKRGKRPTGGPRGGQSPPLPLAGSPAFVSVFVFVSIYGSISFIMNHIFYYDVKSTQPHCLQPPEPSMGHEWALPLSPCTGTLP